MDGERLDQLLSWMPVARYSWWRSTREDSFIRQRLMACKIRLPTRTDDVLMRYEVMDVDMCDSQAKHIGETFFEGTFQSDGESSCGALPRTQKQTEALEQW